LHWENAVLCLRVLGVLLFVALWSAGAAAKDMALVSNKSNDVTEVSMPQLVKICKGQTNRWPTGRPVTFFSRDPASPEMKLVLEKVYGMSKEEVSALITTANHGRANHPAIVVVNSDRNLVEAVESTPGAIGLVDVYSITGGITVLRVEGKLPLEAGYPLHGNQ
jgi:ABC-type phosphate transport system substrate-binding protein